MANDLFFRNLNSLPPAVQYSTCGWQLILLFLVLSFTYLKEEMFELNILIHKNWFLLIPSHRTFCIYKQDSSFSLRHTDGGPSVPQNQARAELLFLTHNNFPHKPNSNIHWKWSLLFFNFVEKSLNAKLLCLKQRWSCTGLASFQHLLTE